jgi:hypothetical protein
MISTAPPSLAISPPAFKQVVSAGDALQVVVFNTGKGPETITMNLAAVERTKTGACQVVPGRPWGDNAISPASFNLTAGQHRTVKLTLDAPDAAQVKAHTAPVGMQDFALFAASAPAKSGQVRLVDEVGAQFLGQYPGKTPQGAPKPCLTLAAAPTPGGFPWPLAGGLAAFAAALSGGLLLWRRRSNGRNDHRPDGTSVGGVTS